MADNITSFEPSTGREIRATDVGSDILVQHVKPVHSDDSAITAAQDATAAGSVLQAGAEARSTAPTAVGDGDAVRIQATTSGVVRAELTDPTGAKSVVGTDGSAHGASQVGVRVFGTDGTNDQQVRVSSNGTTAVSLENGAGSTVYPTHGSAANGNGLHAMAEARNTSLGTSVDEGDAVRIQADLWGRVITQPYSGRGLRGHQPTNLTTTSETTIVTAVVGTWLDLVALHVDNANTTNPVTVTIKDATAGTTRLVIHLLAGERDTIIFPMPLDQASANNNWTATCAGTSPNVYITAQFFKQT